MNNSQSSLTVITALMMFPNEDILVAYSNDRMPRGTGLPTILPKEGESDLSVFHELMNDVLNLTPEQVKLLTVEEHAHSTLTQKVVEKRYVVKLPPSIAVISQNGWSIGIHKPSVAQLGFEHVSLEAQAAIINIQNGAYQKLMG